MDLFYGEDNSALEESENKLRDTYGRVRVLVESEDDVRFWYIVFRRFAPGLRVEVEPGVRLTNMEGNEKESKRKRGKQAVLSQWNTLGQYKIVCVDSDYDHLVPDRGQDAILMQKGKPYVFQTYTNSIENYRCLAGGLDCVCVDATCSTEIEFDFACFLQEYSEIVHELFLYSVYSEKVGNLSKPITIDQFGETVAVTQHPDVKDNAKSELDTLREKIAASLSEADAGNPHISLRDELESLGAQLCELGVTPQKVYLFMDGHALFGTVTQIVQRVACRLKTQKRNQINEETSDSQERRDLHSAYDGQIYNPGVLLRINKDFLDSGSSLLDRIRQDIEFYLAQHPANPV